MEGGERGRGRGRETEREREREGESILEDGGSKQLIFLSEADLHAHFSFTVSASGRSSKSVHLRHASTESQ